MGHTSEDLGVGVILASGIVGSRCQNGSSVIYLSSVLDSRPSELAIFSDKLCPYSAKGPAATPGFCPTKCVTTLSRSKRDRYWDLPPALDTLLEDSQRPSKPPSWPGLTKLAGPGLPWTTLPNGARHRTLLLQSPSILLPALSIPPTPFLCGPATVLCSKSCAVTRGYRPAGGLQGPI